MNLLSTTTLTMTTNTLTFLVVCIFYYITFQITIRDGNFTDIDGLDPTITWENSNVLSNDVALQVRGLPLEYCRHLFGCTYHHSSLYEFYTDCVVDNRIHDMFIVRNRPLGKNHQPRLPPPTHVGPCLPRICQSICSIGTS